MKLGGVLEKIQFLRESYYDYNLVKRHFNLSADGLKSLLFRTNKKLIDKIGADTLDLVLSRYDKVSLGLTQFRVRSGKYKLEDILLLDFYSLLPESKLDFYKVEDCEREIKTLYQYSNLGMKEALSYCDKDKLSFLLYILQNTTERYKEDQKDLISLLLGINWSIDEYLKKLSQLRGEDVYSVFEEEVVDNAVDGAILSDDFVSNSDSVEDDFVPLTDESEFDFSFLKEDTEEEKDLVSNTEETVVNSKNIWNNPLFKQEEEEDDDDVLEDL